jgi:hypothetical protein
LKSTFGFNVSRRIFAIGKVWGVFTGTPTYLNTSPKNGMKAYRNSTPRPRLGHFKTRNPTVSDIFNELTLTEVLVSRQSSDRPDVDPDRREDHFVVSL